MALYHATQDIIEIDSIASKLTPAENALRHKVMSSIIAHNKAYTPETDQERKTLEYLRTLNVLDSAECVQAIYPVSARPTTKRVQLLASHQEAFALCAVDALGFHWTFGEPIRIDARCEETHQDFVINVDDESAVEVQGVQPEDIRVLTHNLKHSTTWSSCCCTIMHFFSSQEALESWVGKHACTCADYYWLTLAEATKFAQNLFPEDECLA